MKSQNGISARILESIENYKQNIAIKTEFSNEISYQDLEISVNDLAKDIYKQCNNQNFIGIMMNRNIGMVISILSVLFCGAAYIPVDPSFPNDRQTYILDHSKCNVLLIGSDIYQSKLMMENLSGLDENLLFSYPVDIIIIIDCQNGNLIKSIYRNGLLNDKLGIKDQYTNDSRKIAYVLYTSGSTGKPKGVVVYQDSVLNIIDCFAQEIEITCSDKVLGLTTICFDISVLEIFMPLLYGSILVLATSKSQKDPFRLIEIIEKMDVTIMQATPSTFEMCLAAQWKGKKDLKILCGGEAFRSSIRPLVQTCHSLRNVYGPTETTIWSSSFLVPKDIDTECEAIVPIGKPISQTQFFIVNSAGTILKVGEEGELWIGGIGVAKGYIYAEDLTKEKFIKNPFGQGMVYKTGDIVKELEDGNFLYIRRTDDQVKLNGYRIELGEIECVLCKSESVKQAVALIEDGKRLIAFIKLVESKQIDITEMGLMSKLKDIEKEILFQASSQLTTYMIPSEIRFVDEYPMTPNGKLDKKRLIELKCCFRSQLTGLDEVCHRFNTPINNQLRERNFSRKGLLSEDKLGNGTRLQTYSKLSLLERLFKCVFKFGSKSLENNLEGVSSKNEEVFELEYLDGSGSNGSFNGAIAQKNLPYRKTLQHLIIDIVEEFSGISIKPNDTFALLGIDSLGAVMFIQKLRSQLDQISIAPSQIFDSDKSVYRFSLELESRLQVERPGLIENLELHLIQKDPESLEGGFNEQLKEKSNANYRSFESVALSNRVFLEGVRGLLAIWVFYDHFGSPYLPVRKTADTFLFIVLSGLTTGLQVKASTLKNQSQNTSNAERIHSYWNFRGFLFNRFIGLFPIYWLAMLFSIPKVIVEYPYAHLSQPQFGGLIVMYTFALQTWTKWSNLVFGDLFFTGVLWNLFLVFAILNKAATSNWSIYFKYAVYLIVFSALLLVELLEFGYRTPSTYGPFFLFGYLLSESLYYLIKADNMRRLERSRASLNIESEKTERTLYSLLFQYGPDFLFLSILFTLCWDRWDLKAAENSIFNIAMINVGYPISAGILILWSMLQCRDKKSLFSKFLCENRFIVLIGECSYAMYMFQLLIVDFYLRIIFTGPHFMHKIFTRKHYFVYQYGWAKKQALGIHFISFFITLSVSILIQKVFQEKIISWLVIRFNRPSIDRSKEILQRHEQRPPNKA